MNPTITRILSWLVAIMVPFILLMTIIRILFTPVYPQIVYRLPGFPTDTYGFTLEDRLHWSRVSMEYLLNDSQIDFLAEQQLQDGQSLYNERELSHMVDVKQVLRGMISAWTVLLAVMAGLFIWAWRGGWLTDFINGLGHGGKLTIALVLFILAGVAVSFNALFTAFHRIFFTGDTWLFLYSDTLIRLFPVPFWMNAFILMGSLTLIGAALLIVLQKRWQH